MTSTYRSKHSSVRDSRAAGTQTVYTLLTTCVLTPEGKSSISLKLVQVLLRAKPPVPGAEKRVQVHVPEPRTCGGPPPTPDASPTHSISGCETAAQACVQEV